MLATQHHTSLLMRVKLIKQINLLGKKTNVSNAYGQCKTSRYNRPPHDKKVLEQCEKIATRCSNRIKQLLDEKKKLHDVINNLFTEYS